MPPEICLMKTLLRHSAPIVCAAGLAAALAAPAPALAQQGAVRATHGAWSIVCDTPPGASAEQCVLMQNVVAAVPQSRHMQLDHVDPVVQVLAEITVGHHVG